MLSRLVQENNYEGVHGCIYQLKEKEDWRLTFVNDYMVADACRDAVLAGNEKIVQLFLTEGLNPDAYAHKSGSSGCLSRLKYFAAKVGNLSLVKLLVDNGAQIKDAQHFSDRDDNQGAMRAAVEKGHVDVVFYLLENGGSADGVFYGWDNQTFLGRAASEGFFEIADLLVEYGADVESALDLNFEIYKKSRQKLREALSQFSDKNRKRKARYASDEEMVTWDEKRLELISKKETLESRYLASVRFLMDHAMGMNFPKEKSGYFSGPYGGLLFLKKLDISGFNFIGVSIDAQPINRKMLEKEKLKGFEKALLTYSDLTNLSDDERKECLIERLQIKADSLGHTIQSDGIVNFIPLADAAEKGDLEIVEARLAAGGDPNQKISDMVNGKAAIIAAAKNGHLEVVRLLAKHPKLQSEIRLTAIEIAEREGYQEIVECLNSYIGVNEKDPDGYAQIHKAVKKKDIKKIKELIGQGADINLQTDGGFTPLQLAVLSRSQTKTTKKDVALVQFLLENRADPNLYSRRSPLAFAASRGSLELMALLFPVTELKNEEKHSLFDR